MKGKTFLHLLLFMVATMVLCSCQRESSEFYDNDISNEISEEVVNSLRFAPITNEVNLRAGANLGIVRITLGRASRNCFGFGICEADWFPGWSEWWDDITSRSSETQLKSADGIVVVDDKGQEFVELKLSELPKGFSLKDLSMVVDKDLEMPNSGENAFEPGMKVEKGVYEFSRELGQFGGYRIPVIPSDR